MTYGEVEAIGDLVESTEHRHLSMRGLALYAQRVGKVFAHPATCGKLIRERGGRRPRLSLAPKYYSEYALGMERVTATLDEQTLAKIRHVAGPRGVSSFLNEAARERLARLELRGLLDELDAKHGAAPAAVRAEIARDARRIFRAR